ncbi:MAG: hypothetical protein QF486_00490 [Candidatus Woesearchaeota archaeon]|jgi:hypothetical protein|nr:hypothetical protein [Candidatus Woesearchaeota archaeon]MDP7181299.1 hypothetical protein [Candidatus Woesearchaeota archaeon]MDP7198082.1 hypothetical protein [Candidatus Woesearchaeota archaeon]MDP7466916.1 hypothetical protein [Candidatus Woesearchaeota archaeon]MDP7647351.1 hypothetical protein [Candidatus Woesearchaeota archaeon]
MAFPLKRALAALATVVIGGSISNEYRQDNALKNKVDPAELNQLLQEAPSADMRANYHFTTNTRMKGTDTEKDYGTIHVRAYDHTQDGWQGGPLQFQDGSDFVGKDRDGIDRVFAFVTAPDGRTVKVADFAQPWVAKSGPTWYPNMSGVGKPTASAKPMSELPGQAAKAWNASFEKNVRSDWNAYVGK